MLNNLFIQTIFYLLNYFQQKGPKKKLNVVAHGNKLKEWVPVVALEKIPEHIARLKIQQNRH